MNSYTDRGPQVVQEQTPNVGKANCSEDAAGLSMKWQLDKEEESLVKTIKGCNRYNASRWKMVQK